MDLIVWETFYFSTCACLQKQTEKIEKDRREINCPNECLQSYKPEWLQFENQALFDIMILD